jgi:hypothetical protein
MVITGELPYWVLPYFLQHVLYLHIQTLGHALQLHSVSAFRIRTTIVSTIVLWTTRHPLSTLGQCSAFRIFIPYPYHPCGATTHSLLGNVLHSVSSLCICIGHEGCGLNSVFRILYPYYSTYSRVASPPYSVFRIPYPYSVFAALAPTPYSVFRIRIPYLRLWPQLRITYPYPYSALRLWHHLRIPYPYPYSV